MLSDRDYMRTQPKQWWESPTKVLLAVLVGVFLVQCVALVYGGVRLSDRFGLSLSGIQHGQVYQFLTFQFLHSVPWPWHVLFNGLALWFFGRELEEFLGAKRFLTVYFLGGLIGGALEVLLLWLRPMGFGDSVVGASAGVMALIGAFAMFFPNREGCFVFYFFPVTLRAIVFFYAALTLAVFGVIFPFGGYAHAAHLGGLLTGALLAKRFRMAEGHTDESWVGQLVAPRSGGESISLRRVATRKQRGAEIDELPAADFISKEVDPILDKIAAHGMQSLTERERKTLDGARAKMAKRG